MDAAWERQRQQQKYSLTQLTLGSPRRRRMGTAQTRLSHGGRCCHRGRCRRLVQPCRVPLVIQTDAWTIASTTGRAANDWRVKGPVTRRRVTCTQRNYRHKLAGHKNVDGPVICEWSSHWSDDTRRRLTRSVLLCVCLVYTITMNACHTVLQCATK